MIMKGEIKDRHNTLIYFQKVFVQKVVQISLYRSGINLLNQPHTPNHFVQGQK